MIQNKIMDPIHTIFLIEQVIFLRKTFTYSEFEERLIIIILVEAKKKDNDFVRQNGNQAVNPELVFIDNVTDISSLSIWHVVGKRLPIFVKKERNMLQ